MWNDDGAKRRILSCVPSWCLVDTWAVEVWLLTSASLFRPILKQCTGKSIEAPLLPYRLKISPSMAGRWECDTDPLSRKLSLQWFSTQFAMQIK